MPDCRELERQLAAICRSVAARVARESESDDEGAADGAAADSAAAEDEASQKAGSGVAAGGAAEGVDGGEVAGDSKGEDVRATVGGGAAAAATGAEAEAEAEAEEEEEEGGRAMSVERLSAVLGPPKFDGPKDAAQRISRPGIATGLAYTSVRAAADESPTAHARPPSDCPTTAQPLGDCPTPPQPRRDRRATAQPAATAERLSARKKCPFSPCLCSVA